MATISPVHLCDQPENIVRLFVAQNLITNLDIVEKGVIVTDAQGRNNPILICCGNKTFLCKVPDALKSSSKLLLDNEKRAIKHLEGYANLANCILKLEMLGDETELMKVYVSASGFEPFAAFVSDSSVVIPDGLFAFAERQGQILKFLHQVEDQSFPSNIPWVLLLDAPPLAMYRTSNAAAREVISIVQNSSVMLSGLVRARKCWHPSKLGHGDARWENWLVNPTSREQIIIDFETFGCIDPRWDIAAYVSEPLRRWAISDHQRDRDKWAFLLNVITRHLLRGYTSDTQSLDIETVLFCGAWLIQRVYEIAHVQSGINEQLTRTLQLAESMMRSPEEILCDLFQ